MMDDAGSMGSLHADIDAHGRWVARQPGGRQADLRQRSLPGIDLQGVNLKEAVLRDVNFAGATLQRANLVRADLRFASLWEADLRDADLSGALLDGATLKGARLTGANFSGASLVGTNLDAVLMSWFDPTLVSERLWRAAGQDITHRMVAAFIGRQRNRCWVDHQDIPFRQRNWVLNQFRSWVRDGDEAPLIISLPYRKGGAP